MATLNELYVYLETKRNPDSVDSLFPSWRMFGGTLRCGGCGGFAIRRS